MKEVPTALSEMYVRITDIDRNELFAGNQTVDSEDVEIDIGDAGTVGQGLIVHGDNYQSGSESSFGGYTGYALVEDNGDAPPWEIDTAVVFGASIMNQSFTDTVAAQNKFAAQGKNLIVNNHAVSGDNTQEMLDRIDAVIALYVDAAATTVWIVHAGGNDLRSSYPLDADIIDANLRLIVNKIKTAGFMLAMSNLTYRLEPNAQSEPYNTGVVQAIVDEFADIKLNLYDFVFDNQDTWFSEDGVHPSNPVGRELTQNYIVDVVAPNISNVEVPEGDYLQDALIQFGDSDVMTGGLNKAPSTGNVVVGIDVYNTDYTQVPNAVMKFRYTDLRNNSGRGDRADPTDTSLTITNSIGLSDSCFIETEGRNIEVDLSASKLDPNSNYRVEVTASRSVSDPTGLDRVSIIDIAGTEISLDASLLVPPVGTAVKTGAELMASTIVCSMGVGASFSYWSMMRITKVI